MGLFGCLFALKCFALFLVIIIIPFVTSLSFNFDSFNLNDTDVTYEGDASQANGAIQLTSNQSDRDVNASIGRATYSKALHLWDKATGNVTDFTTYFSFSINSLGNTRYGDGIAFFLAPAGSRIPDNATTGGSLGLTSDTQRLNLFGNQFVAVEFDTFSDFYDPKGEHVGIDINSMKSAVTVNWLSSIPDGRKTNARISYDSISKNLSVVFTGFQLLEDDKTTVTVLQNLSYNIDLKEYLPERVTFGFTGATGDPFELQSIYSWNFTSSLVDNGGVTDPLGPPLKLGLKDINPGIALPSKNRLGLTVGLISGSCVLVIVCFLMLFVFWRRKKVREDKFEGSMIDELESSTAPKKFRYSMLARCTNNFARELKLGEGGFGVVYKGYLRESNSYIAVKRISRESKQGFKEYAAEVRTISRIRHKHLVQLIGWCHKGRELLLVYEFMPNGSLDTHLFNGEIHLEWPIRYKIVQGLASALHYLQEEWEQCVLHRDIKSNNIMLDAKFNAKLGDFGLARLVDHEKESHTTFPAGTPGYIAPEYFLTCRASKETDVYSFGVVILEIVCGRRPIVLIAEPHQVFIVEWVRRLYGMGNLREAVDPRLSSEFDEEEIMQLLILGLWCTHSDNKCRPSIREAIRVLNFEGPLPDLRLSMRMPTDCSAPPHSPAASSSSSSECGTNCPEIALTQTQYSENRDKNDSSYKKESSAASSPSAQPETH